MEGVCAFVIYGGGVGVKYSVETVILSKISLNFRFTEFWSEQGRWKQVWVSVYIIFVFFHFAFLKIFVISKVKWGSVFMCVCFVFRVVVVLVVMTLGTHLH